MTPWGVPVQTQRPYLYERRIKTPLKSRFVIRELERMTKASVSINTHWMQTCVDADVTKHFRKDRRWWLSSYASLPRYISAALNRAIQLAQNKKTAASLSSGNQKKRKQMNVSFLHNSFSVDPSTEMFTDSYHPPSYSHLSLDTFQKTGPFHLPSRWEEICSLMAFKTGSTDNTKKGRSEEKRALIPPPPTSSRTSVDASFEETSVAAHCRLCQGANCASHTDLHLQATRYHLSNRRILPLNGLAQSQWSLNAIQGSGSELCFQFVCYCILCSQLLCKKKKKKKILYHYTE